MADLVIIEWEDSRRPDGAWKHLGDTHAWDSVKCASVGWLLVDDKEKKVLAPNMGDIDDASNMQMSGEIVIPTSCVLRVSRLNEVTSSSRLRAVPKLKPLRS
jgi:hypothetical protein